MRPIAVLLLLFASSLRAQTNDSQRLYNDSVLVRIDITIDQTKLQWIYNNVKSDSEHVASVRFRNGTIDETVDSIGFRLRGNTSRDAKKKSFKISFNSFVKGRQFHGIEKLNLNGEHNDPSVIRSKLVADLYVDIGMPASRANHARMYINGKYYGLYVSVEHIDEEFLKKRYTDDSGNLWKCLYPADLKYLGSDPNLYKNLKNGTVPTYELSTNETAGDFSALAKLIDVINNTQTASLTDSLEQYLHVERFLQYLAVNTLVGSWDDYRSLMNNYYLYHIPSEKKFTIIPYDYDNTFGVDWFNVNWATADPYNYPKAVAGARPLSDRVLANDQYRDLFTHFLRFYRERVFLLPLWEPRIDRLKGLIDAAAAEDSFRTLDYNFTVADYNNSYTSSAFQKLHVKFGLKGFVNARNSSIAGQLNSKNSAAFIYTSSFAPKRPSSSDSVSVTASAFGPAGIKQMWVEFYSSPLSAMTVLPMSFAGIPLTKHVEEADMWKAMLPPVAAGATARYRIFVKDSLDRVTTYPRAGSVEIKSASSVSPSAVINEFMADNGSIPDSAGQFDDWVELYNPTSSAVRLTNKFLTDKNGTFTKWKFTQPDLSLPPGGRVIVWCDEELDQKGIHANFKLSAGGEFIALTDSDGVTVLDSITFGAQKKDLSFGRYPDGSASWDFMLPSPLKANTSITSVRPSGSIPKDFTVAAFPNPFNPATTIRYSLPKEQSVTMSITDLLGREVWNRSAERISGGEHSIVWNGKNDRGVSLSSGMYLFRLQAGKSYSILKLMLLK
ncbi:MAG: CotH kinase family protein [Bacteroidota bacterium]